MQTTIRNTTQCSGIGLHSGRKVTLTLAPAAQDTGIVFVLHTEKGTHFLRPSPEHVAGTELATTLGTGEYTVSTVEHLLAAVRGLGIDNLRIEVSGPQMPLEVPVMDGSAASFVFLLKGAGIRTLDAPRTWLAAQKRFEHREEEKYIRVDPFAGFRVDYLIDFEHPLIGTQSCTFDLTPENFSAEIARARTFGFLRDVEFLHKNGMALGGSLDNAVVLDEYGVINDDGLRFADEFVRHKVLDFIGDMAVAPLPLLGHFTVRCSGHAFNNAFLRVLMDNAASCLEQVQEEEKTVQGQPRAADQPAADGVPVAL